jgi:flagellar basal-body rod protein FlgB
VSGLVDPTQSILLGALDGLARRQSTITSNLANIDTPGYTPKAVDFETALRQELEATQAAPGNALRPDAGPSADAALRVSDARHFAAPGSLGGSGDAAAESFDGSLRNDANRVDLESEMTALSQTQIKYAAVTRMTNAKFGELLTVIGGR